MRTAWIIARGICTGVAIVNAASALRLPVPFAIGETQQPLEHHLSDDLGLEILSDPAKVDEIFWALTSDDAARAFDEVSAQQHTLRATKIAMGHHLNILSIQSDSHAAPKHASLEISMSTIGGYPVYHAPIAIGNPAQPFRAWLNTHLNGLYVRSSACSTRDCGLGWTYNASKSSTRKSLERRFEVQPKDWTVGGNVSSDTLHLTSVDVEEALVGEIDKYQGEDLFYYVMEFVVDGALGLAPPDAETPAYLPSLVPNPLYELVRSHSVEHNVFTITLPETVNDIGALQIGKSSQAKKNTVRIPFRNRTSPGLAQSWHVPLESVSLAGRTGLHLSLKSVFGRLDLEPTIGLPPKATREVYRVLGAKPNDIFRGATIDCKNRGKLPDLMLDIGGNKIKLGKEEYSFEQSIYGHPICVVAIVPTEGDDVAVLGTNFLRKFHAEFDIDRHELGLTPR